MVKMAPEDKGRMKYEDRLRFAVGVLKGIGAPLTAGNTEVLLAWMSRENTQARYNPMATTFPSTGWEAHNYRTTANGSKVPHVKHYPSFDEGVRSTILTLLGYSDGNLLSDRQVAEELDVEPRYPVVLDLLRQGTDVEEILNNSEATEELVEWGTFEGRVGFAAENTWGYTKKELEVESPGYELEELYSETLRPIEGYDFPNSTKSVVQSEPMDSWNRGRNSPTDNDLKQVGPSEREVQLENEWIKNKGNEFRQREIINEILQERNREGYPNPPENSVSSAEQIAIDQGLLEEGATDIGDPLPNLQPGYTEDYEFLRGVPEGEVEFAGQTWNIVDLLEAERDRELGDLVDPSFYFESTDPKYLLWVQGLYEQTQHFFQSAENQALRENNWFKSGDNDEFNPRQLSLLETTITNVEKIFNEAGIVATETELLKFARDAWIQGWSTDAIKDELSNREDMEFGTDAPTASLINASRQDIQSKYRQYLQPIDPEIIAEQNRKLWRGETDLNTIEAGLASDAADVYTAWADRIEAGRTPLQILNSFDPIFRSVMGYTPEWDGNHQTIAMQLGTGAVTGAGLASYLRSTDEYDLTPNAINNAYSLIGTIGETMGVMP